MKRSDKIISAAVVLLIVSAVFQMYDIKVMAETLSWLAIIFGLYWMFGDHDDEV